MKVRARAPLRLGLAGGGTDVSPYCDLYGGSVMNATIDRYVYATVEDALPGTVVFEIKERDLSYAMSPSEAVQKGRSGLLHQAVYKRIADDYLDGAGPSIRLSTMSESPAGSGLGSSSALVVAMVQAMAEHFSLSLGDYEIAHLAYEIERVDLGLAGGKQDHYAAAFGGFNFMEFFDKGMAIVNPLKVKPRIISEIEASIVLYFTGVSRESANIIQQQVDNVVAGNSQSLEAMHQLKEESVAMKRHILRSDIAGLIRTIDAGWMAKKRMAQRISNPMIDHLERVARNAGALSCKISGAGGGGYMFFFTDPGDRMRLIRALSEEGGLVSSCHFTQEGAMAWRVT